MAEDKNARQLSGTKKAAVLLISLGTSISSAVMQQLTPDEVERLAAEIVQMRKIDPETRKAVLEESKKRLGEDIAVGGLEYAQQVLASVFGEARATELLSKCTGAGLIRWLETVPAPQLAQALWGERAQVIAMVLGHLSPDQGAQVLSALPEKLQGEVILRMTNMQPMDPEVVKNVADHLLQRLSSSGRAAFSEAGGTKSVVSMLTNVDRTTQKKILDYLASVDEGVAKEIQDALFVFEDIVKLDDRTIQIILRDVPAEDLRLALKGVPDHIKETFFRNMSTRAAQTLKEDLEASGPVKLRQVEAAQRRIANIARQLEEAGEITIGDTGETVIT